MGPKKRAKSGGGKAGKDGAKVGQSLVKDRNRSTRTSGAASWRHTSELDDGYDWGRLNLRSVTEESQLDEFLNIAQLAGTEFTAERLNMKVVSEEGKRFTGLPSLEQREEAKRVEEEKKFLLSIPRRPPWDADTTAEQLELLERESFLAWRRSLVQLQEDERLTLTPFERNLEFWRQLWRVVEKSDVVVQILDARDPLLFRCEDLEKYVREVGRAKVNVLLLSKADLLSEQQRCQWLEYFNKDESIVVAFWSAKMESERIDEDAKRTLDPESDSSSVPEPEMEVDEEDEDDSQSMDGGAPEPEITPHDVESSCGHGKQKATPTLVVEGVGVVSLLDKEVGQEVPTGVRERDNMEKGEGDGRGVDEAAVLSGEELLELLARVSPVGRDALTTVGMVGYPNVGKSSTINALFRGKKVPVSATPGRTKHFQTLYLNEHVLLCDCPGLVFPSFVSSKAEMICSGILPIDQMRDHTPPVSLVCQRIPRVVLEQIYGIVLPLPPEGEDFDRAPYADELLSAFGRMRGFMTSHGQPDESRSSRYILKDYVSGKLLYCHSPPGIDGRSFNHQLCLPSEDGARGTQSEGGTTTDLDLQSDEKETPRKIQSTFDDSYFKMSRVQAVVKGVSGSRTPTSGEPGQTVEGKPWKKHNNKHKKEKTRRLQ